ncbi:hypothetical protein TVNIR_2342 [Thioalkalivibrio nitratireducens DSM 14787]|uniref:Uncharacterized protein n=1 Tax=Thioalkalivibrio nitratireducens (strain DSM 14787 / UNIQEM 213 / ALEN2) TaxID=1255043 RepID=L0DYF0_THIND|nr:hypothetical protein TVNIR_2342 [Thioalkalivibrio nitratireducens DSM 14787]
MDHDFPPVGRSSLCSVSRQVVAAARYAPRDSIPWRVMREARRTAGCPQPIRTDSAARKKPVLRSFPAPGRCAVPGFVPPASAQRTARVPAPPRSDEECRWARGCCRGANPQSGQGFIPSLQLKNSPPGLCGLH